MSTLVDNDWIAIRFPDKQPQQIIDTLRAASVTLADVSGHRVRDIVKIEELRTRLLSNKIKKTPGSISARVWISALCDLVSQGWRLKLDIDKIFIRNPEKFDTDPLAEKDRVRLGHLLERDRFLREESTRCFVAEMEATRLFNGEWHSIFSLFRDGKELSHKLSRLGTLKNTSDKHYREAVDPYIQIAEPDAVCGFTGIKLLDIWRYFRLTWSTIPQSVPGRRMFILIRDRAAKYHPVIGIAALGSAVVQLGVRDQWIGWSPDSFMLWLRDNSTVRNARWLLGCVENTIKDIYIRDFIKEGLISRAELRVPSKIVVDKLRREGAKSRAAHEYYARSTKHKTASTKLEDTNWRKQAETYLFRSKRAIALSDMLEVRVIFREHGLVSANRQALRELLLSKSGKKALAAALRSAKSRHVGIDMADITVCGALPPYTHILGGKLVSLLIGSPEIVEAYRRKYTKAISVIASAVKGQLVRRRPNLVFVGTTSLYGVSSSQYNRLVIPASELGPQSKGELRFIELGRTIGFGSYHFSQVTTDEMAVLAQQRRGGRRVNNIFGEGVNPKLRRIREALEQTGFPSDALLRHGSPRLVYGVPLAMNFREILMERAKRPQWIVRAHSPAAGTELIASFWHRRWLSNRLKSPEILSQVAQHSVFRPVRHGARVRLSGDELGLPLFIASDG